MTLETIERTQLAQALRLVDGSGEISERTVANLFRTALARWGLSPERTMLKYARDQLRAAALDDRGVVTRVLARMMALGECDRVLVGPEVYVAPGEPRWVPVGDGAGSYLGICGPPEGITTAAGNHGDIVQRISVTSEDDAARLQGAGVREVSLAEWFCPIDYLRHASRRLGKPARSDAVTLAGFWDLLEAELVKEGLPLSVDAEVRAVTGEPGSFFGRHDATQPEGRWTTAIPPGIWCGARRGYGETQWHPTIIAATGEEWRALDLYDLDEWRWALIARGKRFGADEVALASNGVLRLTFPPPAQLRAAMDLLGAPNAPWSWGLHAGAPDIWALLR